MENEPKLIETYVQTGKVRLVYRHLLQLGDGSLRAAEAAECAGDQGKFWQMHELLFERQEALYEPEQIEQTLTGLASELELNTATFGQCMESHTHREKIQAGYQAAQDAGIRSRPTFEINGERLIGGQSFSLFQERIEAALMP